MDFFSFLKKFPTELAVIEHFIKVRYQGKVTCRHCAESDYVYHRSTEPKVFTCHHCKNSFSIFYGTIFENSRTDLRKWFYALIRMSHVGRKGISAMQLQREIGVTYKCAHRMLNFIRIGMGNCDLFNSFEAVVEIDETYIGGKPRKGQVNYDGNGKPIPIKKGRGTQKIPAIGVYERETGRVYARVALPNKEGKKLTGKQLLNILECVCRNDTIVVTDEFKGYNILDKKDCNGMIRLKIDHTQAYVSGDVHTNGIESFWALLKRGIHGIYHQVSSKYLQRYLDEFCFRMNNRSAYAFDILLRQCINY